MRCLASVTNCAFVGFNPVDAGIDWLDVDGNPVDVQGASLEAQIIPVPAAGLLLASALAGLAWRRRRA
ncbi:MAG: hypothetical protein AAFX85_10585 [Pseudomonadota bacterium]